ncbi:MAG: hypothetical protein IJE75_02470, partial [Firmicutes bacterium]|nr:hypothetical protein [Bacillota bacterium]
FVGFGFSEVFDGITSEATVADILGYSNLSDFYEYNEKSNDAIEEVNDDFMDYCEENGLDSDDQYVLQTWLSQNYDKYADKMAEIRPEGTLDTPEDIRYQDASCVAALGAKLYAEKGGLSYNEVQPEYMRMAEAERKLKEQQAKG